MKRKSSALLALCLVSLLFAGSCSVKEDRSECPCTLVLDFSGSDPESFVDLSFSSSDGFLHRSSVSLGEQTVFEFKVPRTDLSVNAFYGDDGCLDDSHGLMIPPSNQCPEIYLETLRLDTRCELLDTAIVPRKSFCRIDVCFEEISQFRYEASVVGKVCGYTLDGELRKGEFKYGLHPDDTGRCSVRVPRQDDGSLFLELKDKDGYVKRFALGEYIAESGFDWTKPDLGDVVVEIDYARTQVVFRIKDWEKTVSFDVVI